MGSKNLGHIAEIMKNDFKAAFSNPIVTIVLIAIIILPSLYALLNIQACWDPYGNTGNVEFAIANLDKGATFEDQKINVGNELVKDLKKNDKFDWKFVTEKELRDGVYNGDYYAGIVIPKNLSKNIVSIASDDPKQAELEYVVNVKSNPVATKLTDTGANTVYTTLNAKIIQIINLAAYGKLGELQEGLAAGASQLAGGGAQLQAGAAQVSSGASQVAGGVGQVEDGASQVKEGASQVEQGAGDVKQGAGQVQQGSEAVQQGASQVQQGSEELDAAVDPSLIPEGPVKEYVNSSSQLAKGSGKVAEGSSQVAQGASALADGSVQLAEGSSQVAGGASALADGSVQLAEGSLSLAAGAELLGNSAAQALFTAAGSLGASADQLSAITGINETLLGDYFFSPVKLDRHEVFSVPDYGSNVAPFYLVLSMWVGALITCVMMEPKSSVGTKYSPFEMYSGKLLIYVIMSILQACVTLIGAHLLGVHVENYPLFIFSAILVSVVFMILIYSIISAIGTVGKGLAVILLVLQISATGGIYPIQIMHQFFQTLYPYMPMTYAIKLIREAQLGVVWSNYWPALIILLAIGIITVIVAIAIKEKADKPAKYFEEKLEESGLF
ncbi:MAG: YhgE/Pip domain-containing protein [Methanobrevibacter sp.]|uniref:YhgE/Pip domain-containing protein n=1 Tax=Methanobrevibacter sp. TaxID=66852 RepID=UPI0025D8D6B3|nr:YhgE/Pip domain-containing protein [Methanobrevibacter sp.]MBR3112309.1 YhgE/Pip domain-containing protein [Methanobrevibacter sp.]MBR3113911.1 YhgE/Pip domain-containing protein [Methanobrevibacter sp.]